MLVRDAVQTDSAAIAALLTELGYPSGAQAVARWVERQVPPLNGVLVADAGGVVGMAAFHIFEMLPAERPWCRITALVVAKEARSRGVGAGLVAAIEDRAAKAGCEGVELTSSHRRQRAHAFYLRCGYEDGSRRFSKRLLGTGVR